MGEVVDSWKKFDTAREHDFRDIILGLMAHISLPAESDYVDIADVFISHFDNQKTRELPFETRVDRALSIGMRDLSTSLEFRDIDFTPLQDAIKKYLNSDS